jgi:hypothetical protein
MFIGGITFFGYILAAEPMPDKCSRARKVAPTPDECSRAREDAPTPGECFQAREDALTLDECGSLWRHPDVGRVHLEAEPPIWRGWAATLSPLWRAPQLGPPSPAAVQVQDSERRYETKQRATVT